MYFPKHLLKDKVELVAGEGPGEWDGGAEGGGNEEVGREGVYDSVKWLRSGGITMPISR